MINESKLWSYIAASVLTAVEIAIICALISNVLPYKPDPLLADILFHYRKGYVPERELLLYMCGMGSGIVMFAVCVWRKPRSLWLYSAMQAGFLSLQIMAAFYVVRTNTAAAWGTLYLTVVLSVLMKIFFKEISAWIAHRTKS